MSRWPDMERRGGNVSESDVAGFEARFGHTMPADYRQFLLDVNGGRPADTHAEFSDGVVNQLFSLGDAKESRSLEVRANRAQLPSKDLLFIGHDDGSGRLLLALEGEHRGEVWLQIPDARPNESNPRTEWHDRRDMKKVADGFAAFMRSLTPLA